MTRAFAATLVVAAAALDLSQEFEAFKLKFERKYADATEELKRFKIFLSNAERMEQMQILDEFATYSLMTKFADMSESEFKAMQGLNFAEFDEAEHEAKMLKEILPTDDLPTNFDWREKGAVNDVKDQAQCGSCWAFGTVANIEGAGVVQGGEELLNLSEQELVSCSKSDMGCNGGLPSRAYKDLLTGSISGKGLEAEADYPYTSGAGVAGTCKLEESKEVGFIDDWVSVSTDEDQIKAALYKYGPLAVGLNANPLQMYSGGVLDPWMCSGAMIDHAVTLVGWGTEDSKDKSWPWDKTKDYWLVRNSWGGSWGEQGYFKIARGKGQCGINRMVTTAIVKPKEQTIVV